MIETDVKQGSADRSGRSTRSFRVVLAAVVLAAALGASPRLIAATPSDVTARESRRETELASLLATSRDERARMMAAVALGKAGGPRAAAALTAALHDRSAKVRGIAASALGQLGGEVTAAARATLGVLARDPVKDVRTRARMALAKLIVSPAPAAAPASSPRAGAAASFLVPKETPRLGATGASHGLAVALRVNTSARLTPRKPLGPAFLRALRTELARQPGIVLDAPDRSAGFVIDGMITRLDRVLGRPWVEVTCEVKLTVSTGDGRIVGMVSGRATVQTPRAHYRPTMDASLEDDALVNAVRGANQNVLASMGVGRKLALR